MTKVFRFFPPLSYGILVEADASVLRPELQKGAPQLAVDAHDGARIVKVTAVIRRRKDSDAPALREELVPLVDYLVRAADQINVVLRGESLYNIGAKGPRNAAVVLAPPV